MFLSINHSLTCALIDYNLLLHEKHALYLYLYYKAECLYQAPPTFALAFEEQPRVVASWVRDVPLLALYAWLMRLFSQKEIKKENYKIRS